MLAAKSTAMQKTGLLESILTTVGDQELSQVRPEVLRKAHRNRGSKVQTTYGLRLQISSWIALSVTMMMTAAVWSSSVWSLPGTTDGQSHVLAVVAGRRPLLVQAIASLANCLDVYSSSPRCREGLMRTLWFSTLLLAVVGALAFAPVPQQLRLWT